MSIVLAFLNFMILIVWVRVWSRPDSEFSFNPLLTGTSRLTDKIISPVATGLHLSALPAAIFTLLGLIAFKCLVVIRFSLPADVLLIPFCFPAPVSDASTRELIRPILFTLSSTFAGLISLWGAYTIVTVLTSHRRKPGRAAEALAYYARPFSLLSPIVAPIAILLIGALAVAALTLTGGRPVVPEFLVEIYARVSAWGAERLGSSFTMPVPDAAILYSGPFGTRLMAFLLVGLELASAGIGLISNALVFLVIGRVLSFMLRNHAFGDLLGEFIDALEGRFARRLSTASMDWTPLVFFFVLAFLSTAVNAVAFILLGRLGL